MYLNIIIIHSTILLFCGSIINILKRLILISKKTESDKYNIKLEDEVKKQLLELREKDKLLIAQSKLAAVGETLAHIAHQWKQPLTSLSSINLYH